MRKITCMVVALAVAFTLWIGVPQADVQDLRTRTKVDQKTGVKFSLERQFARVVGGRTGIEEQDPCLPAKMMGHAHVIVEVPETIDLSNDNIARQLLDNSLNYAFTQCTKEKLSNFMASTLISLYKSPFDPKTMENGWIVRGRPDHYKNFAIVDYKNKALENKLAEEKKQKDEEEKKQRDRKNEEERKRAEAEAEIQRNARKEEEARRQAERLAEQRAQQQKAEEERRKITNRRDLFTKENGVKAWPSADALQANPFVHQGKTVAILARFEEMSSATDGLFAIGSNPIVVSDIPSGAFTSRRWVILAGTVLGKREVQLPLLGKVAVPHLKYVNVLPCSDEKCDGLGNK